MSLSTAVAALAVAVTTAIRVTNPAGSTAQGPVSPAQRVQTLYAKMTVTSRPAQTFAAREKTPPPPRVTRVLYGTASWYGPGFHGRRTASGERFDRNRSTIASRGLPFGTRVRVTYLKTGRSAVARVNDRGPFHRGRLIDCSEALARNIGLRSSGSGRVKVEVLDRRSRY